ncbi:MAG: gluconate 5-dehydrogenase [Gammaproteobacteria bacterium]|nr:MAG: gluconate 5-dehydrogenase [Gammaproteobacteria bacterium]
MGHTVNTTDLFRLDNRRALITGSSRGIGYRLAVGLAASGADVVINGTTAEGVDKAVVALNDAVGRDAAIGRAFDITDGDAVENAVAAIEDENGAIDILVNNAGIQRRVPLLDCDTATWQEVLRTNLDSVFHVGRAVARHMVARERGKIINICSMQSELGRPSIAPYAASKGGVKMLTKNMCAEWAKHNIQVNGLGPGYFVTELTAALVDDREFSAWVENRTPAGRWGEVDELIGGAVFLASDASSFVNGHILYVDGGMSAVV